MKMFSLIIDQLICGEHAGGITTIDILNLSSQITPPISKSEAEQIMKKLVREDWLHNEVYFKVYICSVPSDIVTIFICQEALRITGFLKIKCLCLSSDRFS